MRFLSKHILSEKMHSSIFRKWVISYASILLMPILLCSFYYFHSYNILKERTLTNQHLVLQNFGEQVDSAIYDVVNLGNHLKINKYVNAISTHTHTVNSTLTLDRHYLRDELRAHQASNSLFDSISIYFPETGYVINCNSSYKLDLYPYLDNKSTNISPSDWTQIIHALKDTSIVGFSPESYNGISVSQMLKTNLSGEPAAILCVQINKAQLLSFLHDNILEQYPCSFSLINSNRILISTDSNTIPLDKLPLTEIYEHCNKSENTSLLKTKTTGNSQSIVVDCLNTKIPDIKLISVTEKKLYEADLTHLLELLFITLAICLFTGLIIIMIYSRRNYKPVEQIVHYINKINDTPEQDNNEYQLIMKMLTHKQNEIEYQHTLLKNSYLQKILSGEISFHQISESVATQLAIQLPEENVYIVLLDTHRTNEEAYNESENPEPLSNQLVYFIIENVFSELLEPQFTYRHFIIRNQQIAVLINTSHNSSETLLLLRNLTGSLCEFLSESYHLTISAGISALHDKQHIADAFLQSETALEYCSLFHEGHISLYDLIPQNPKINTIPLHTTEYLINLVDNGNLPDLTNYFRNIDAELKNTELSWADLKSCFYFFYQTTARLKLHCQTQYGMIPESLDFIDNTFFNRPLAEALSQTSAAFTHASAAISETQSHLSAARWGTDICTFIENNYFDTNINLNSIAQHFHVSAAYLSRKFKEQYQKSVIDYLYEIRIANAKKLMHETSLKVAEIAEITGFVDSNAFIRVFKKYTGTTPGKYITSQIIPS